MTVRSFRAAGGLDIRRERRGALSAASMVKNLIRRYDVALAGALTMTAFVAGISGHILTAGIAGAVVIILIGETSKADARANAQTRKGGER